jgi:hypothetical protein
MLVSDLVIINNNGEVNSHIKDLLWVCIYAIDNLNSKSHSSANRTNEKREPIQANKVIFA